jgi:hypothetical protein
MPKVRPRAAALAIFVAAALPVAAWWIDGQWHAASVAAGLALGLCVYNWRLILDRVLW